ncbi:rho GDP-dissociation inhibitor 1-like [Papaver somniferum]|uniref:rho GDP-dissociation inhibitor 1-like n=1 Tax=Papaver somniferum TaxID=3469 RepID=UPI000E6FBDCD|nr:rho GDP-dissociation inhibitor 1-like [Papaver somniferum]
MSLGVRGASNLSENMKFDDAKEGSNMNNGGVSEVTTTLQTDKAQDDVVSASEDKKISEKQRKDCTSAYTTDQEDDDDDEKIDLGPPKSIKQQLELDKEDESLRRWKEQLLGSVDLETVGESLEPDVKILSLAILSPDRPDLVLSIPEVGNPKGLWFTLKEGSRYSLKFSFTVNSNIVSGLKYTNTVWKTGMKVDRRKEMLGVFSPQAEAYTHEMPEEITPSGIFARGSYSARTKFVDDDNKRYLEMNYTFDIRKDWPSV